MSDLFVREPSNPILVPSAAWWEAGGVLNPGVVTAGDRVVMIYRAAGIDHISRMGITWSDDGRRFTSRGLYYEAPPSDYEARLGVEDPRLTWLEETLYATYTKVAVAPVGSPMLSWEPAPFQLRTALAKIDLNGALSAERIVSTQRAKDGVLFPRRIGDRYYALLREYPDIQIVSSVDLQTWSIPQTIMRPIAGTWEGERIGAGPPPIETPWGWLLIYHANEFYQQPGNRRHYRTGLVVLDRDNPARVRYRHPDPIFVPETDYERSGPVGMVVFATGLVVRDERYYLYYGAADGVIGLATAPVADVLALIARGIDAGASSAQ